MSEAEISKKCQIILINEALPRAKKLGITLHEFYDASLLGWLARCEYEGVITRKQLREILDHRVNVLKNDNI